jgi:hypothetical protein
VNRCIVDDDAKASHDSPPRLSHVGLAFLGHRVTGVNAPFSTSCAAIRVISKDPAWSRAPGSASDRNRLYSSIRGFTPGSVGEIAVKKFQAGILAAGRVLGGLLSSDVGRRANMERGPDRLRSSSSGTCCAMAVPGGHLLGHVDRASDMQRHAEVSATPERAVSRGTTRPVREDGAGVAPGRRGGHGRCRRQFRAAGVSGRVIP